jgi:hypothetical protein
LQYLNFEYLLYCHDEEGVVSWEGSFVFALWIVFSSFSSWYFLEVEIALGPQWYMGFLRKLWNPLLQEYSDL